MPVSIEKKKDKHIYLLVSVYILGIFVTFFCDFFKCENIAKSSIVDVTTKMNKILHNIINHEVMIFHYQEHFKRIMFFEMFCKEYQ